MFLLLFPDVALILAGFILSRRTDWGAQFWSGLEKINYFWLFPALLYRSIVAQPVGLDVAGPLIWCVLILITCATAIAFASRWVIRPAPIRLASTMQCAFRFNSYILLALCARLGGAQATSLAAVCIGVGVPVCNALAVGFLAHHGGSNVIGELIRNPLIIATLGAALTNALGVHLPEPVDTLLLRAGNAALALGLISVGAGIRLDSASGDRALLGWITATRLIATPAIALVLVALFDLPHASRVALVAYAAVPTASSCYILANRMGGDGPFTAMVVSVSTMAAIVTIPFWLWAADLHT